MKKWVYVLINCATIILPFIAALAVVNGHTGDIINATAQQLIIVGIALVLNIPVFLFSTYIKGKFRKTLTVIFGVIFIAIGAVFVMATSGYSDFITYPLGIRAFHGFAIFALYFGFIYYVFASILLPKIMIPFSNLIVLGISYLLGLLFASFGGSSVFLMFWLPFIVGLIACIISMFIAANEYYEWLAKRGYLDVHKDKKEKYTKKDPTLKGRAKYFAHAERQEFPDVWKSSDGVTTFVRTGNNEYKMRPILNEHDTYHLEISESGEENMVKNKK